MSGEVVRFAGFELDRAAYQLRHKGRVVHLERIPLELLFLLVERRGQLVTREEIRHRIWPADVFVDEVSSINTAIRKLRRVLRDTPASSRFLETVSTKGYRFVAMAHETVAKTVPIRQSESGCTDDDLKKIPVTPSQRGEHGKSRLRQVILNSPSITELRSKLASQSIFEGLDPTELASLAERVQWRSVVGGSTLFSEGDPGDYLFVVLSGRVGAFKRNANGHLELLAQTGPGETVGEMAVLSNKPRTATIITLRDTELVCLSKEVFYDLASRWPKMMQAVANTVAIRLRNELESRATSSGPLSVAVESVNDGIHASGEQRPKRQFRTPYFSRR